MELKFITKLKLLAVIFLLIPILILPFLVIQFVQTDSPQPYVFKAKIIEKLDETLNGKLQYFSVEHIEGNSPNITFVIAVDKAYSRGLSNIVLENDGELWMQGSLMTREVFYGEQYLFFDLPQIYVRQIKDKGFWPDQITELKILYISPFSSLLIPLLLLSCIFIQGCALETNFLNLIGKTILVFVAVFLLVKYRKRSWSIVLIFLIYALLAMMLTIPVLTELY